MPSKYPVCTPEEILRALINAGFIKISQKGSHIKLRQGNRIVIVPMHCKDVKVGTLKSILEQADMQTEDLIYYLG